MEPRSIRHCKILYDLFKNNNYTLFLVGGSVRDFVMDKVPKDYDFTTNATPEQMIDMFNKNSIKYIPTGKKYGTLTVMIDGFSYEITTYRKDSNKTDGRRPESVTFSTHIKDDLSRRDFTINAMAINVKDFLEYVYKDKGKLKKSILDPYNGLQDIENKIIRTVGISEERFKEDGLRIMRAIRFACKYNFKIHNETLQSIYKNHECLDNISKERIQSEFNQIILSFNGRTNKRPLDVEFQNKYILVSFIVKKLFKPMKLLSTRSHNSAYHEHDPFVHSLFVCATVSDDLETKLAALFHDVGKLAVESYDCRKLVNHFYDHAEKSEQLCRDILISFKYPNKTIDNVCKIIKYHDYEILNNKRNLKKIMPEFDEELFKKLLDVKYSDRADHFMINNDGLDYERFSDTLDMYLSIKENEEAFSIKDLNINGNDLKALGISEGPMVGKILRHCLDECIEHPEYNDKNQLINIAKSLIE